MRKLIAPAFAATLLALSAASAQDRPRVVAVTYPLQFFAERLLGDAAEVVFPVPPETDPSFWRPSISDISSIQSADLIMLNGAGFATWIDRVSLPRSRVVNTSSAFSDQYIVTETITHSHGDGGEHSHEGLANYIWLDPALAGQQAGAIAAAAVRRGLVPQDAADARLAALQADLSALAEAAVPATEAVFIATHPRYQYLARAFGLRIEALEWEAGAAPDAAQLADLQAKMDGSGATVLIWEAEPPAASREAVQAMGLTSVIFPPLAHAPARGDYLSAMQKALSDLASAAQ